MALSRRIRAVLSGLCWTLAVVSAVFTAAAFLGGGVLCQAGERQACRPQTWLLVVGVALALAFGVVGSMLYKPPRKREPRFPWEYPK